MRSPDLALIYCIVISAMIVCQQPVNIALFYIGIGILIIAGTVDLIKLLR